MRFKVDENIHSEVAKSLRLREHDALSVGEQGHQGCPDAGLARVCPHEDRVLITQDLDFSNILVYPPENFPGIALLRLADQSNRSCLAALERLLAVSSPETIARSLWIVDESQIRVRAGRMDK
ncbi:MAG: DUF5615 family PIN-like protein [Planctomycetota bacterium]